jgi:hypothetical protein
MYAMPIIRVTRLIDEIGVQLRVGRMVGQFITH